MRAPAKAQRAVRLIFHHFGHLKDPRVARTRRHPLMHVLVMALCAAVGGADGPKAMARFARTHRRFFRRFLTLQHGTPSADTFRRVFGALSASAFEEAFRAWVGALHEGVGAGSTVALDGKALRAALQVTGRPLHLVHVWAADARLLLGQARVDGAPGEVAALPQLIRALDLQGACVTVDANGLTKEVASACAAQGAHYVICLKGNRGPKHRLVQRLFAILMLQGQLPVPAESRSATRSASSGHGRREVREAWAVRLEPALRRRLGYAGLQSAVLLRRERHVGGRLQVQWHTYLSSLPPHAPRLLRSVRAHWGVENSLHWCLDVGFGEDRRRVRHEACAENLARVHRLALTLLQRETTLRAGIALKRQEAGWDDRYLARVLSVGLA